jgi:O-acetylserine/cysteine efflux transporter
MSPRDIILALGVACAWGLNFVAIRWGVDEIPPLLLSALRYIFAALPAVFFIRRPDVSLRLLVTYGMLIGVLQFGLLFWAISLGMPAGLASLVMQLQAFFTIAIAALLIGERPRPAQLLGAAVALLGVWVIASQRIGGAAFVPLLMTVLAAAAWGAGNVVSKTAGKVDMLSFVVWSSLVPPIPLLVLSMIIEGPGAASAALSALTVKGAGSVLFIAYASTLFGYGLWNVLLSRYPASTVAPFSLLVPVFGFTSAALLLGEQITAFEIAGGALVLLGLVVNVVGGRVRPVPAG